jgi:hypothetical protein
MRVLVSKNGQQEAADAAVQNSARVFLILSFSVLGLALAYFGAVYLITR